MIPRDEIFEKAREMVIAGEDARGFALFELLADLGDAESQNNLGWLYETGKGVEKSLEKANQYYKMAADQGLVSSQYNLALNYETGLGVEKDYAKAMEYYQMGGCPGPRKVDQQYWESVRRRLWRGTGLCQGDGILSGFIGQRV